MRMIKEWLDRNRGWVELMAVITIWLVIITVVLILVTPRVQ